MPQTGVFIRGMFIGADASEYDGKARYMVGVAVGLTAYRVYMSRPDGISAYKMGDMVTIACRPYSGKSGLGFSEGEFVEE